MQLDPHVLVIVLTLFLSALPRPYFTEKSSALHNLIDARNVSKESKQVGLRVEKAEGGMRGALGSSAVDQGQVLHNLRPARYQKGNSREQGGKLVLIVYESCSSR